MRVISRTLIVFLGLSVLSVWSAVIVLLMTNEQSVITAASHGKTQIGIEDKDTVFESSRVYAINNEKEYYVRKLSDINAANRSDKVSIDVLLEELDLN